MPTLLWIVSENTSDRYSYNGKRWKMIVSNKPAGIYHLKLKVPSAL